MTSGEEKGKTRFVNWKGNVDHKCRDGCCDDYGGNSFAPLEVTDEEIEEIVPEVEREQVEAARNRFVGVLQSTPRGRWRKSGGGEITVDSAAEESVCPQAWGEQYQTRRPARWMRFVNASGGEMNHYGEKTATFMTKSGDVMSLGFQVSDVRKPLTAVWRIAEKRNKIQLGPLDEDNFIMNVASGKKVAMGRKGGS